MNLLVELWDDLPWYGRVTVGFIGVLVVLNIVNLVIFAVTA